MPDPFLPYSYPFLVFKISNILRLPLLYRSKLLKSSQGPASFRTFIQCANSCSIIHRFCLPIVDSLPIFYNYITSQRRCYVCALAEVTLCSPNFKLITTLLARRTRLAIFTLSRGPVFHLSCFLPSLLFSPSPPPP